MRFSCLGFRGKSVLCTVAAVAGVMFVAGCSEDPGLQERLNRLQAEMQEKDRQLQDAQSALEKTKSELKSARAAGASKPVAADTPAPTASATPQFLPREQVEESYASGSKAMQKRIVSELRNYTVENCTQFPVWMPSDDSPYHSKVALTFRSDSGRSFRLEFPVSADASGKWTFPNSVDIASALADSHPQDQTTGATASNPTPTPANSPKVAQTNATPSTPSRTSTPSNAEIVPGQTATETRTIDWGGGRPTGGNRPSQTPATTKNVPPAQQPTPVREVQQPTPQGSKPPAQTMQSDKDVTIHW